MNNKLDQYNLYNQNNQLNISEMESNANSNNESNANSNNESNANSNNESNANSNNESNANSNNESDANSNNIINSKSSKSSNNSMSSKQYNIINKHSLKKTTNLDFNLDYNFNSNSDSDSDKIYANNSSYKNIGYINKNGNKINKIKDLFTDELQINTENTEKYDSDKNGYFEINDAFADFKKYNHNSNQKNNKHNSKNLIKLTEPNSIKKIIPLENSISNNKSYTTNTKERSFNPNSAIKNSKIFKIPI